MAKLRSLIKIEGTLDDLTFYKTKEGYLIRTKGGVSKNRIASDPAFARTRENNAEFGHSATAGKILRRAILDMINDAKDPRVASRLTTVMSKVKNLDTVSQRGKRNVTQGLLSAEGKSLLKGFDFNNRAVLTSVLLKEPVLDTATAEVQLQAFNPSVHVDVPQGATHIVLTAGVVAIDFQEGNSELVTSNALTIPITNTETDVVLTPASVPTITGPKMYLFKVAFLQEVNADLYVLNNGAFNVLNILEVA
ncbi:MAG: hypothetical protein RQ756_04745 [Flavobacteriaceae bacterium]|nr:hypothetical protein [Flavobacteriaceae bacterium]